MKITLEIPESYAPLLSHWGDTIKHAAALLADYASHDFGVPADKTVEEVYEDITLTLSRLTYLVPPLSVLYEAMRVEIQKGKEASDRAANEQGHLKFVTE